MMDDVKIERELLFNIVRIFDNYVNNIINEVLEDDEVDPQYSAVTANNYIQWYIAANRVLGTPLPYQDTKGYFANNLYSDEEYKLFEEKRSKEATYYRGKQY